MKPSHLLWDVVLLRARIEVDPRVKFPPDHEDAVLRVLDDLAQKGEIVGRIDDHGKAASGLDAPAGVARSQESRSGIHGSGPVRDFALRALVEGANANPAMIEATIDTVRTTLGMPSLN